MPSNSENGDLPKSNAGHKSDRKQLDALLNLLAELQDRQSTTITVESALADPITESGTVSLDLENGLTDRLTVTSEPHSLALAHLPDYLKQLADEAGIDITKTAAAIAPELGSVNPPVRISRREETPTNPPPEQKPGSLTARTHVPPFVEIESQVDNIEEIADSMAYLQDLLLNYVTTSQPTLTDAAPDRSPSPTDRPTGTQKNSGVPIPESPPQNQSPDSREAVELLQNILVQPEVATLRQSLEQLEQKVVVLAEKIDDPTAMDSLDQKLAAIQNRVNDTSAMQSVQAEMANLAKQQTNIPSQIANLKQKLADLDQKLAIQFAELQGQVSDRSLVEGIQIEQANLVGVQAKLTADLSDLGRRITKIDRLISNPQELTELLLPLLNNLISREVEISGEELANALAPIADRIVDRNIQAGKEPMSTALAPVIPSAIRQQIINSPGEFANAIAPELGPAITDQVKNNADTMIDALYPIIGSTIAKYIAEAIRNINEKVENTLSVEGVSRKVRAKLQGVSEAELIFKESMAFKVQAVFLIHKGSGLVIAEAQPAEERVLESDMIAGMLTAIRSFANDCISSVGSASELDEIDYGSFKILLEVAGFCYLAIVVEGEPPLQFIRKVRQTLSKIVQEYHRQIEQFDGDPETIPVQVPQITGELVESHIRQKPTQSKGLLILGALILGLAIVPWGVWQYRQGIERRTIATASEALLATPELSVYRLSVEVHQERVVLQGRVPDRYLRSLAEQVTKTALSDRDIDNQIVAVRVPPNPIQVALEVERAIATFNQLDGIKIKAAYTNGKVTVEGTAPSQNNAQQISQSLARIPGVDAVVTTVETTVPNLKTQILFNIDSAQIEVKEAKKIEQVRDFLRRYPTYHLRIVGGSDNIGFIETNRQLALERAQTVKAALIEQGIDAQRLQAVASPKLGLGENEPQWTGRRVEFELVKPSTRNK
jgi:outer membrane protein OmpA-like peptidoglycan-associated protein